MTTTPENETTKPSRSDAPTCSRSSKTPETDAMQGNGLHQVTDAFDHARRLERQRNIAVAALRELAARYGHKSAPGCGCDDCAHIRPIEEAIAAATSPANAEAIRSAGDNTPTPQ